MIIKANSWDEVDFTVVDPNLDTIRIGSKEYRMSDHVCHNCWEGGTVMESEEELYCVQCGNQLIWYEIEVQFIDEENARGEKFLLPAEWDEAQINQWKTIFLEKRNIELKFRDFLLKNPEGGEFYGNDK